MSDTWYQFVCPNCRKANLVCAGDANDQTVPDVDGFNCWNCGKDVEIVQDEFGDDLTDDFGEPLLVVNNKSGGMTKQGYPVPVRANPITRKGVS